MPQDAVVLVNRESGVVHVTMNRPERKNAANGAMWNALLEVFREVASNSSDRVMVLTGAGGAFCSGADIADPSGVGGHLGDPHLVRMRFLGEVMLALRQVPKPTIAKVGGVAAGAGASLAFGCDLIVASQGARFSEIFARRGLSLDGGSSWLLPRMVGLHRAKELAFFGEMLSAAEAAEFGLVNRVVPEEELDAFVDGWAARLAAGPPLALSMTKTLLDNSHAVSMAQALEDEARCQAVNFATSDTSEAMRAFVEKREPRFEGR
jgi:2-(1,2-epoxy-1,2-dihydrophenyl)acetyl-CoA isomerase